MRYTRTLLLFLVVLLLAACGRKLPEDVPMAGAGSALQQSGDTVIQDDLEGRVTDDVVVEDESTVETVSQSAGLRSEVIVSLSRVANPENGEEIFHNLTADGFTCADCHSTDSAETTVGPGLFDIPNRIALAGEVPQVRLYNGIVDPSVHPVLSENYTDLLTNSEIYDVLAYMMSLRDPASVVIEVQVTPEVAQAAAPEDTAPEGEAVAAADDSAAPAAEEDSVAMMVNIADAANGETLFNQMNATGFACATCHAPDSEQVMVGPGLLHIPTRAAERVAGQGAQTYIYNSILHPADYVVDGFANNLMPANYEDIYSTKEIYDIVAYLMTLDG